MHGRYNMWQIVLCVCLLLFGCRGQTNRPHIIVILADDLGWNDVGFHGSNQIPTPNIDALAFSGIVLQNYYVTPVCTPSRSAFMTGKYPIHTGMQHAVIYGTQRKGLPLNEKILPQYLKDLGYKTHLVGKWHLGHYRREYLPTNRGFDTHIGHWTGKIDLFDHINLERPGVLGFDFRKGFEPAYDLYGKYATDVYTEEAIKIIDAHKKTEPLFLMVAHSAVHSGNPFDPLRAPERDVAKFNITNEMRRKFAGVLSKMDESVGKVIDSLQKNGLLENSIVLFSTDNGGPAAGFNENAASNYPLRGVKNSLWEGGVRGAGVLWSPLLERRSRVASQRAHIVDWLPTLYGAAGGNLSVFKNIDGIDQWEALSKDGMSQRASLVLNIDDILGNAAITIDQWKVIKGDSNKGAWDSWYGPGGRSGHYNMEKLNSGLATRAIRSLGLMPTSDTVLRMREQATVKCDRNQSAIPCKPLVAPCLFNIESDPCEIRNLANQEPEILMRMLGELESVNKTAVPPIAPAIVDEYGNPKYWGYLYLNFGDYENESPCVSE